MEWPAMAMERASRSNRGICSICSAMQGLAKLVQSISRHRETSLNASSMLQLHRDASRQFVTDG
jgi:hypothetical protein